jgi:hypothetical protein
MVVIASAKLGPELSFDVLSKDSDIPSGTPILAAALATPMDSGILLNVAASAKSTSASFNVSSWTE